MPAILPQVVTFKEVDKDDTGLVGGKGANLGEMTQAGFPIPPGFIITSAAYFRLVEENRLYPQIRAILTNFNPDRPKELNAASAAVKRLILSARIADDLAGKIIRAYENLGRGSLNTLVAVRSSATAEDLPGASFAGQQETYLNVSGEANLIQHVRACWASLFEPRAIFYRQEKGFDHFKVGIAVPVQKMVASEVSGIMFTVNPVTSDKNQIVIEAIWGLGEKIVQGAYTPDHYLVQKQTYKVLQKQVNPQKLQLVLKHRDNREVRVKKSYVGRAKLSDEEIVALARLGQKVQDHYFFPQDIEWAREKGRFYLVQSRPVTTLSAAAKSQPVITDGLKPLLKGEPASPGLAVGYPRVLKSAREIGELKTGEILVTEMTTPDFVPAMKKAAAIVTDTGGQTSHAAIVSRELGIPCVVGAATATRVLRNNQVVTVNGQTGEIFRGGTIKAKKTLQVEANVLVPGTVSAKKLRPDFTPTATKLYVNLGEPDLAGTVAQKNVDGVGLLRAEFMIAQVGVHPRKLIGQGREKVFVDSLVAGLGSFCRAFSPRPVVYRATDFKTNEYAHLSGGAKFEPIEPNPMLGFRGAYRYLIDQAVFSLELQALKIVRNKLGFTNLHLMLPFVRTVGELAAVKKIISDHGLIRSHSFKLWQMVEIPSNVILLDEFIDAGIDGVSIGSNDLTMLILGVDRDNSQVAPEYDELNPAVLWALKRVIQTCHKRRITSSICGQAPSVHPQLTEKLIEWGITSVSVTPDMIDTTRKIICRAERKVLNHGQNR